MYESLKNWGRWGDDDQRGALNHLTPQRRLAAASFVRDGTTVSLAHDLGTEPSPENPHPVHHHMLASGDARDSQRHPGLRGGSRLRRPRRPRSVHDARRRAVAHVRARRDVRRAAGVRGAQRRRAIEHDHVDGRRRRRTRRAARHPPCARHRLPRPRPARDRRRPRGRRSRRGRARRTGRRPARRVGPRRRGARPKRRVRRDGRAAPRVPAVAARSRDRGARQRRHLRPDAVPRHPGLAVPGAPDRHHGEWACTSSTTWRSARWRRVARTRAGGSSCSRWRRCASRAARAAR